MIPTCRDQEYSFDHSLTAESTQAGVVVVR